MRRSTFAAGLAAGLGVSLAHVHPADAFDERGLGEEVFYGLRDDGEILFDSPYYEHLDEVGQLVSAAARERYPYPIHYVVVKGDSANAFSVPGGNIYVNEPLLQMAVNRDELAGVLAHETGHMVLHHVARRMKQQNLLDTIGTIGSVAAQIFLGPFASIPADYAMGVAQTAQDMNASRHIEAQADEEGARIIAATNEFNPYGMIWFFQKMIATYGDKGAFWMQSHPFSSARITDLEHLFASNPNVFGKYSNTRRADETYW